MVLALLLVACGDGSGARSSQEGDATGRLVVRSLPNRGGDYTEGGFLIIRVEGAGQTDTGHAPIGDEAHVAVDEQLPAGHYRVAAWQYSCSSRCSEPDDLAFTDGARGANGGGCERSVDVESGATATIDVRPQPGRRPDCMTEDGTVTSSRATTMLKSD